MFWGGAEPSFEEKIDYIYNDLRAKKRWVILKWIFRLVIFWLIIHFYIFILPTLNKDKIIDEFWNQVIDIVIPLIEKTLNNVDLEKIQNNQLQKIQLENLNINKW